MNKQNKQELNNHQSVIEDLTVNKNHAEEVKGGPDQLNPPSWGLDRVDQRSLP